MTACNWQRTHLVTFLWRWKWFIPSKCLAYSEQRGRWIFPYKWWPKDNKIYICPSSYMKYSCKYQLPTHLFLAWWSKATCKKYFQSDFIKSLFYVVTKKSEDIHSDLTKSLFWNWPPSTCIASHCPLLHLCSLVSPGYTQSTRNLFCQQQCSILKQMLMKPTLTLFWFCLLQKTFIFTFLQTRVFLGFEHHATFTVHTALITCTFF